MIYVFSKRNYYVLYYNSCIEYTEIIKKQNSYKVQSYTTTLLLSLLYIQSYSRKGEKGGTMYMQKAPKIGRQFPCSGQ